jgi:hypothetical protein
MNSASGPLLYSTVHILRAVFIFDEHAYDIIEITRPASMSRDEMSLPGTNVPETEKP